MFRHVTTRIAGLIIVIAGVWGGLIPFLGPTFHFTLGPDVAWHWNNSRLWLSVLPSIAAVLGGLILMGRGPRLSGRFGALLALAGGVWFAVGPDVSMLWNHGVSAQGVAHGAHTITRMLEYLTLHSGIGVLITAMAAYSLPGVTRAPVERHRVERDAAVAGTGAAVGAAAESRHRDRVDERQGEPVGRGEPTEGRHRVGRDAAIAGTGAAAGAAAEKHHRDRVEEREGEPVGDQRGEAPAAGVGAAGTRENEAQPAGANEPAGTANNQPVAEGGANQPAGTGNNQPAAEGGANERTGAADEPTANDAAGEPAGTQTGTQRRGGLAGFFSRR